MKLEFNTQYLRVWWYIQDLDNLKNILNRNRFRRNSRSDRDPQINQLLQECIRLRKEDIAKEAVLLTKDQVKRIVYDLTFSRAREPLKALGRHTGVNFNVSGSNPE